MFYVIPLSGRLVKGDVLELSMFPCPRVFYRGDLLLLYPNLLELVV